MLYFDKIIISGFNILLSREITFKVRLYGPLHTFQQIEDILKYNLLHVFLAHLSTLLFMTKARTHVKKEKRIPHACVAFRV